MSATRVGICIPSTDTVMTDFAMCLAALTYDPGAAICLINNKGSLVAINRNNGVEQALKWDCTHVLFLDTDMVFPRDLLKKLLKHDKDIVGCTYVKRVPPFTNLAVPLNRQTAVVSGLTEVEALPTGCLLIKTDVFKAMEKPWFQTPLIPNPEGGMMISGEDYHACREFKKLGYKIYMDADLSYAIGHVGTKIYRIQDEEGAVLEQAA